MTASLPSEDEVRAKAYELWVAGGMVHGRDREDWIRAKEILSQHNQPSQNSDSVSSSVAQTMVEGVFGAAQLAMRAAAGAISSVIGSAPAESNAPKAKADTPPGGPTVPNPALEAAEQRLRVEADKRVRDAKTEAAGTTASDAAVSKAKVNPDG